jgi:hypothetical protein
VKTRLRFWPLLFVVGYVQAQSSPQELADSILQRWAAGFAAEFAALYPFPDGRELQANLTRQKITRTKGLSYVVSNDPRRAVLLISGAPLTGNSGDDTYYATMFSGAFEALAGRDSWRLERRIPWDEMGQIVSQQLQVSLRPGRGLDVEDRLMVRVKGGNGFVAVLNHRAKLDSVRTAGAEIRHEFGGGLLWAGLPQGESELTLKYSLEVEDAGNNANSGRFTEAFGHVRNQYFWQPSFGFDSDGDQAEFQVEVRAPKAYEVATSLPQTERVEGEERVVEAKSVQPASTLTLAYDREWQMRNEKAGDVRLDLFLTPAFRPEAGAVVAEFRQLYSFLASRFGAPGNGYMAVVQLRGDPGDYWHFSSNQGVFVAGSPGYFAVQSENPSAQLGHEVGHNWTRGAGPAANFLREGWATYVESLVLEREFGTDVAARFWKLQTRLYFAAYDGKAAMWNSGNASDLNYRKGSWVFRMLEEAVGREAFGRAMTDFSHRSLAGSAGWETLADCFQRQNVPEFDARAFLLPWLKEKGSPHLTAEVTGQTVTITQEGPDFVLPVTVEGTTDRGAERHRVWIRGTKTEVQFAGLVSGVRIDPDEVLLLRR